MQHVQKVFNIYFNNITLCLYHQNNKICNLFTSKIKYKFDFYHFTMILLDKMVIINWLVRTNTALT